MSKRGRPKIEIDEAKLEMLAEFGCSNQELASFFECSEETLRKNYKPIIDKGRELQKISLRRAQFKAVKNGSVPMMIFLGKNLLQQSDKQHIDLTGNLEAVLKECGFEDSNIGEEDSEQGKVLEPDKLQADSESSSSS
tara:strand:+ start:595 stop:1008 length:414 start_codon:yes stop_codon:yes gene_type:complete